MSDELSDAELRARLLQRGLSAETVEALVKNRDDGDAHRRIVEELGL